jgi:hypothetical protein
MQKLIQGLQHYKTKVFGSQRELFERLTEGQSPEVLFITCSDSRINPNLLTQTEPGEVFGYDPDICQFKLLTEQRATLSLPERQFVALEI